jgi:hypothetical protein
MTGGTVNRPAFLAALMVGASILSSADHATRVVHYHANDIVAIRAKMRYTTLIEVPTGEKIMEAATGDKDFWIIEAVQNYCFLHPAKSGIHSNLNLITASLAISKKDYETCKSRLARFGFSEDAGSNLQVSKLSEQLETFLTEETPISAVVYSPKQHDTRHRQQFESVNYWYWEHWKFFRNEVKTSIIQGIAVFLSLFDADPDVRRVFCPPKELYEGKRVESDPKGRVLAPFAELIEEGKIVGLNFPVALNPALAKTIGTMMKIDYQRAVQLRIPKMEVQPERSFRPTVFICDEYQNFATVGGDNPVGDERFFSISRQPKCIPIVATQSVSSLKEALPNEGFKTLMQTFRTKIFLTTSDPDTARFASEICGKVDKTKISYTVAESSNNAQVGWLSGRTSSNKGSVSASKHYQKSKEPLFEERAFLELKNAQAIAVVFDGIHPLPATYCYLKPDFMPLHMTWFDQERINFDPERIERSKPV